MKDYINAINYYKKAIDINKNNNNYFDDINYYISLGNAYYSNQDYENAIILCF